MRLARPTLLLALAIVLAPQGIAESLGGLAATTPAERARFQTEQMTRLLELSPAQAKAVAALNLEYAEKLDPILKGHGSEFERLRKGRQLLSAKDEAMKKLLEAPQYQKYLETKKRIRKALEARYNSSGDG